MQLISVRRREKIGEESIFEEIKAEIFAKVMKHL